MRIFRAFAVVQIALLFGFSARCSAGLGPENVAVVINEDSWASKAIANEFIALYGIPPANVIYLQGLPDFERTDIEFLRAQLLQPVIKLLEQRKLGQQIDCLAWSSDIPYIVDITKDFTSAPSAVVGHAGSITGLTYLYQFVFADREHAPPGSYTLPGNNRYFRHLVASQQRSGADRRADEPAEGGRPPGPQRVMDRRRGYASAARAGMARQRRGALLSGAVPGPSRRPGRGGPIAPARGRVRLGQLARMGGERSVRPAVEPEGVQGGRREIQGGHRGRGALARVPQHRPAGTPRASGLPRRRTCATCSPSCSL